VKSDLVFLEDVYERSAHLGACYGHRQAFRSEDIDLHRIPSATLTEQIGEQERSFVRCGWALEWETADQHAYAPLLECGEPFSQLYSTVQCIVLAGWAYTEDLLQARYECRVESGTKSNDQSIVGQLTTSARFDPTFR